MRRPEVVHGVLRARQSMLLALMLAVAPAVLGCDAERLPTQRISLLTGIEACYAGGARPAYAGVLLPDLVYGTRFDTRPVMWPVGYSGVLLTGGQVAVLNAGGDVVAMTGRAYAITPVPEHGGETDRELARIGGIGVCDSYEWDLEEVPEQLR